jgi:hypothetical protein
MVAVADHLDEEAERVHLSPVERPFGDPLEALGALGESDETRLQAGSVQALAGYGLERRNDCGKRCMQL